MRSLVAALVLAAALAGPGADPAAAAVCADYPNQAAAQAAKDTLDADGDGIYCESLPCPCSPEWEAQHGSGTTDPPAADPEPAKTFTYRGRVTGVVDGDTLKVRVKKQVKTVRVLGIDTPESHKPDVPVECGAKEATSAAFRWAFAKQLDYDGDGLFDHGRRGRDVTLKTDSTQTKFDQYGRLLAYVSRGSSDFGRGQIRGGWAEVFVYASNPFKRYAAYQASFDAAQAAGRGVFSLCGGDFHSAQ